MSDRTSRIILEIKDGFSGPQKQFVDGMKKAEQATGNLSNELQAHSSRQTTLHHMLGVSRREANLSEHALLQLAGANQLASQAVQAFASGLGPMGLLIVGLGVAIETVKGLVESNTKAFEAESNQLMQSNIALDEYIKRKRELERAHSAPAQLQKASDDTANSLQNTSDAMAHWLNVQADANAASQQLAESIGHTAVQERAEAEAALAVGAAYRQTRDKALEQIAVEAARGKSMLETADALAKLNGEEFKSLNVMQQATYLASAEATARRGVFLAMTEINRPIREQEETQATFEAAQFNSRMARSHDLRERIAADTTRIMDLDKQAATNRTNAYAQAAADATRSLESIISGELQLSKVTAADIAAAQVGKATPTHADENIRRVRIFQTIDTNIDTDPEAQRILTLMPQKIRQKLEDAFHAGGTKALHLTAMDLVGGMESFADLSGWDVNVIADNVQRKIEEMKNKKQLTAAVQQVLVGRGFDPNDPETQKALGIETGAERALKVNASISFEKGKLAAEVDKAKKDLDALFATYSPAPALSEGVDKNSTAVQGSGTKAAKNWLDGFDTGLTDGAGNIYNKFFKTLVDGLGDYFVRADTSARGPR